MNYSSFSRVIEDYKVVMLDSYGVVKNHKGLIDGVQESIRTLKQKGKTFRLLTNDASRSQEQQLESLQRLGLHDIELHEIITSGMMARQFLEQKITSGRIAYLGTQNSAEYILQSGLQHVAAGDVDLNDIDDIAAFVFLDDEGFDWNTDINKTVNLLRKKTMPVILSNSDKYYPVAKHDIAVATGGIAKLVETMLGKKFIHFGKPDSQMFMYAYESLVQEIGLLEKNDILMVGDTLETDILGGNRFGVGTMLVLSGNSRAEHVEREISATGIIPDYICEDILS
jgi:HAD superfamily hydrolase (TIGR01450 family)